MTLVKSLPTINIAGPGHHSVKVREYGSAEQGCGMWMSAEWLERLTANVEVANVLGSAPASPDTVESEGAAYEAVLNKVQKKSKKIPL
jgi:hypothetical protein